MAVDRQGRKEVTTRMPPELAHQLRQRARAAGTTVNDFVVALVAGALGNELETVRIQRIRRAEVLLRQGVTAALTEALAVLDDEQQVLAS